MGEFLKCECSHCGQPIEYPSEETGQTVLCLHCGKEITLIGSVAKTASSEEK
jgi:DNA-directed RNA polymerase subunit RPC12/RpoP